MLFSLLSSQGGFAQKLVLLLTWAFCVLLSLTVHEVSHGLAANWMGDKTAKNSGRLSLSPFQHLDPVGAICLFLFGFGWARPVPVNPWNFQHKKGGMALTALAGPLSNFILAFLAQVVVVVLEGLTYRSELLFRIAEATHMLCSYLILVNLGLGIFNLIPLPPLDGSKVLGVILPGRLYIKYLQLERYAFIILIVLINLPLFSKFLYVCESAILSFYNFVIGLIL